MISSKLPNEIIAYIILQLDVPGILHCRTISKNMNTLIETSSLIQYKIELAANGLVACNNTSYSASAALRRLKEQQSSWSRCEWKTENRLELSAGCRTYELRNGIWAYGYNELGKDPAYPTDYTTTITCFTLPSATSSPKDDSWRVQWTLDNLDLAIRDFTMDPLIDLLVLVEQAPEDSDCPFRIHMRRLSDGSPHVMAATPVLDFQIPVDNPVTCSFGMRLYGSRVGVLVRQDADEDCMAVWDWCTGEQQLYLKAYDCSFDDFAFIDWCTVILATLGNNPVALEVWRIEKDERTGHYEPIFPTLIGIFMLPLTTTANAYLNIHFDGSPSCSLAGARALDGTPFIPGPEPYIFALSFGVIENVPELEEATVACFTMVMRPSLMLDILDRSNRDRLGWSEWGTQCTRWLPQDLENLSWEPCSFGGRYAVVGPLNRLGDDTNDDPRVGSQVIRLFDFRPDVVQRLKDSSADVPCIGPSVVPKETLFAHDIVSELPYHIATSRELPVPASGVMIDDGRLVCTQTEFDDEWRTLLVLAF